MDFDQPTSFLRFFFDFFDIWLIKDIIAQTRKKDLEWLTPSYEEEFFWFSSPIARCPFLVSITRNRSFRV